MAASIAGRFERFTLIIISDIPKLYQWNGCVVPAMRLRTAFERFGSRDVPTHRHGIERKWTSTVNVDFSGLTPRAAFDMLVNRVEEAEAAIAVLDAQVKTLLAAAGSGGTTPLPPNPPPDPDLTAPVISGVGVTVTTTTAVIVCTTDEAATVIVEYGTSTAYGTSTSATVSGTSHSRTLSGLTPGQLYHYRIRATDTLGNLRTDSDRTFTTTAAPTLPGPPTGLVATGGNTQIVLTWAAPTSNGGSAITGYRVYRNGSSLVTLGNVLTYTNTGLTNGTTYSYTVAAITAVGEGPQSGSVSASPAAPGDTTAPVISGITVSAITQTGATVAWTTNEASTSRVEYGTTTSYGSATSADASLVTSHSQNLTGLTAGTTYHLRVYSADAAANVAVSADRTFTTQSVPPPPTANPFSFTTA